MIPIEWYTGTYYIVLSSYMILLCLGIFLKDSKTLSETIPNDIGASILLFITILFIGLRDPYASSRYLGDTSTYTRMFNEVQVISIGTSKEWGFTIWTILFSSLTSVTVFYLFSALLYLLPVYLTFRKWFANNAFYGLAVFVTSMSFWSFGINGLRNGIAASIFIFALGFLDRKIFMMIIMIISASFHKSMLLPIGACIISIYLIQSTQIMLRIWIVSIILSFVFGAGIEELILPYMIMIDDARSLSMIDEELSIFTTKSFRFDFLLYSSTPIIVGWYVKYKKGYNNKFYTLLLNSYILTNSIWILFFMYAPFTNRYAYLSWFLMPIVLVYPLINTNLLEVKYKMIGVLILCNLLFTLMMYLK